MAITEAVHITTGLLGMVSGKYTKRVTTISNFLTVLMLFISIFKDGTVFHFGKVSWAENYRVNTPYERARVDTELTGRTFIAKTNHVFGSGIIMAFNGRVLRNFFALKGYHDANNGTMTTEYFGVPFSTILNVAMTTKDNMGKMPVITYEYRSDVDTSGLENDFQESIKHMCATKFFNIEANDVLLRTWYILSDMGNGVYPIDGINFHLNHMMLKSEGLYEGERYGTVIKQESSSESYAEDYTTPKYFGFADTMEPEDKYASAGVIPIESWTDPKYNTMLKRLTLIYKSRDGLFGGEFEYNSTTTLGYMARRDESVCGVGKSSMLLNAHSYVLEANTSAGIVADAIRIVSWLLLILSILRQYFNPIVQKLPKKEILSSMDFQSLQFNSLWFVFAQTMAWILDGDRGDPLFLSEIIAFAKADINNVSVLDMIQIIIALTKLLWPAVLVTHLVMRLFFKGYVIKGTIPAAAALIEAIIITAQNFGENTFFFQMIYPSVGRPGSPNGYLSSARAQFNTIGEMFFMVLAILTISRVAKFYAVINNFPVKKNALIREQVKLGNIFLFTNEMFQIKKKAVESADAATSADSVNLEERKGSRFGSGRLASARLKSLKTIKNMLDASSYDRNAAAIVSGSTLFCISGSFSIQSLITGHLGHLRLEQDPTTKAYFVEDVMDFNSSNIKEVVDKVKVSHLYYA